MEVLKGYTYRLRLTLRQERQVRCFVGAARAVYNRALAEQERRQAAGEPRLGYAGLCRLLTTWRGDPATPWLAEVPVHPLQQKLKDLGAAYTAYAAGRAQRPRFKKKGQSTDSLRFPDPAQVRLDQANGRLKLPKLGWLRYRNSRPVTGDLRSVTLSRDGTHWRVSILTRQCVPAPVHPSTSGVGIDRGVAQTLTLSDGTVYTLPARLKRLEARLEQVQRLLARKQTYSRNWHKVKARIARLHTTIANVRRDFLHQASTAISKNHALVVVEGLQLANMTRSASGTVAAPGRQVAAKAGLNRAILRQGWGLVVTMLAYKLAWRGGRLVTVPSAGTSRTCARCGHQDAANRVAQAVFRCVACGHTAQADVNAAINIHRAGLARCAFPGAAGVG